MCSVAVGGAVLFPWQLVRHASSRAPRLWHAGLPWCEPLRRRCRPMPLVALSPHGPHARVAHVLPCVVARNVCVCGTVVGAWCRWGNALGAVSTGAAAAKPAAGAGAAAKPAAKAAPAKAAKEDSDSDDMFADSDDVRGVVADGGTHVECRVGNRSPRQYPLPPVGPWLALGCARVVFPIAPLTTVVTPLCHCEWPVSS